MPLRRRSRTRAWRWLGAGSPFFDEEGEQVGKGAPAARVMAYGLQEGMQGKLGRAVPVLGITEVEGKLGQAATDLPGCYRRAARG